MVRDQTKEAACGVEEGSDVYAQGLRGWVHTRSVLSSGQG